MKAVLKSFNKVVTTAGTRVALSTAKIYAYGLSIKAPDGNTGFIYVGDVTVSATNGHELDGGQKLEPTANLNDALKGEPIDLSRVYIDSSVNAEGVNVTYLEYEQ